jgi:hypothetical protein
MKYMYYSVDRIEGKYAVCVGFMGRQCLIELEKIDGKVTEGDILAMGADWKFHICTEETKILRDSFFVRFEDLFRQRED